MIDLDKMAKDHPCGPPHGAGDLVSKMMRATTISRVQQTKRLQSPGIRLTQVRHHFLMIYEAAMSDVELIIPPRKVLHLTILSVPMKRNLKT